MWRLHGTSSLVSRLSRVGAARLLTSSSGFHVAQTSTGTVMRSTAVVETLDTSEHGSEFEHATSPQTCKIGQNVSRKDRINFLDQN